MARLPISTRYKLADGRWSAPVLADTVEQARDHLRGYQANGYTEFQIEDAEGQRLTKENLNA